MQERRNSIANALELHFSCTDPLISRETISIHLDAFIDRNNKAYHDICGLQLAEFLNELPPVSMHDKRIGFFRRVPLYHGPVSGLICSKLLTTVTPQLAYKGKVWDVFCKCKILLISFYPSALRAGGVLSSRSGRAGGRAGGCQTCRTHISVTAWWIFSIRSSVELSRPVGVHCHGHMPICPIWACPWAKNLSNLPQIGSRLCGTHISETAGWIYPI